MVSGKELIAKQEGLSRDRATWDNYWSEIAPLVFPRQDIFNNKTAVKGEKRENKKYDDTAVLALTRGAAAIEGVLIPRGQRWHGIDVPAEVEDDYEAQIWADGVRDFLFKRRYAPTANFSSQAHEFILSLLSFGTAVMLVEDIVGHGIRYKTNHISEHYFMENDKGIIDTDFRKYKLTATQAKQRFGDAAPQVVEKALEKEPNKELQFLHVVMPDKDDQAPEGMKFISYHVSIDGGEILSVGGYKTFPYIISRWTTAPNEIYGRSPTMDVLSEIKMLNAIRKTDIQARHMAVSPPILAADQRTIRRLSLKSNAINYGTIDMNGRPLVQPYQAGTNIAVSDDTIEKSRAVINSAFFLDLFQILVESPQQTATEVLQRAQEKGTLLSPSAGRQKNEWLDPLIDRELSIYEAYGIFEDDGLLPMPESIKDLGGSINVKYTNPITHMQQSDEAIATEKTVQALIPVAQIDPTALDVIDWSEYAEIMRAANGAPQRLFKAPETLAAEQEAKAQQEGMAQMAQMAPQMAGAVKDIAQAQSFEEA